jgi:geranylgeranyl diphosphate synthase type II
MSAAPSSVSGLKERLRQRQQQVDARMEQLLPGPDVAPPSIHRAMRHSVFAGGKRIRPVLCLEAAAAAGGHVEPLDLACALECIHTYSLIHDDLPALDNDDFRRGKPTCHKAFGEATAILAGDALLTIAFEIIGGVANAESGGGLRLDGVGGRLCAEIAAAAGTVNGMIGGQVVDIESEGKHVDAATLEYIHRSKTGALLRTSVRSGAIFAGADDATLKTITDYGVHIGLLFQIVDDILDVTESSEALGKTAGKDAAQLKATYPAVHGMEKSVAMAEQSMRAALAAVEPLGERGQWLREIALYLGSRKS